MNPKALLVLLILALVTIFALVCVLVNRREKSSHCGVKSPISLDRSQKNKNMIFAALSAEEMVQVVKYLQLKLPLVDASQAVSSNNFIHYVDVNIPRKEEVLKFLDHDGPRPPRQALAVVYFGNQLEPNVTEYVVGPLPVPAYHWDVTVQKYGKKISYHGRTLILSEFGDIQTFLVEKKFLEAPTFMAQVFGHNGSNFEGILALPGGFQSGDRYSWITLFQNVRGFFLHPLGLEVLVDHSSLNVSDWKVPKVFYNGQYFNSFAELEKEFKAKKVIVTKVKPVSSDGGFSSLHPRTPPLRSGSFYHEPFGSHYNVRNNQVTTPTWSFAFRMGVHRGLHLYDIRFKDQRIVYELGVQDAISIYGSNSPGGMLTRYMDASFGMGRFAHSLVRGVDCPYSATYLDAAYLIENLKPMVHKNSICVFEQNTGTPFRRHFSNFESVYYGGLASSALVMRFIVTIGNYDYVWNFIFHPNGAIESKVQATGYIISSFLYSDGLDYGNRVADHTLGTIHTHVINYRVDLDVGGTKNSLVANDMTFETVNAPWNPEHKIRRMKLVKKVLDTEDKAAFRHNDKMPRYIYFAANSTNKWGHKRGYLIQTTSMAGDHLPEADPMERAISWGRYKLAVTKRKEKEPFSTSIYNQNDPWTPTVAFADFIDNETIVDEDLVAWITTGFLHIPHAEDIPNTVTLANAVGFILRPYNYFDNDPSIDSPDSVFFTDKDDFNSCEINHIACLPKTAACVPNLPPFSYEGFQNLTCSDTVQALSQC